MCLPIKYAIRYGGDKDKLAYESYLTFVTERHLDGLWGAIDSAKKFDTLSAAMHFMGKQQREFDDAAAVPVMQTHSELHYFWNKGPAGGPLDVDVNPWPKGSYGHRRYRVEPGHPRRVERARWCRVDAAKILELQEWGLLGG